MKFPFSISSKILLGVVPAVLVCMVASVWLNNYFQEREMLAQAEASAGTYAEIMREALVSMMVTNYRVDESFLARVDSIKEIDSLRLALNDLHLREDLLTEERIQRLNTKRLLSGYLDSIDKRVLTSGNSEFHKNGDHFRAVIPFKATKVCQECHRVPLNYTLGAADIHISLSAISNAVDENWKRSFSIVVVFLVLALGIGTFAFRRVVADPIDVLMNATQQITSGRLDRPIISPRSRDELGTLSMAFEEMRRSLWETLSELASVNRELAGKNTSLQESLEALRKAQDELLSAERLSAIGQMASSVIHDFKNPMSVVISYADILRKNPAMPEEQRSRAYDAILRSINQMSAMTHDLLYFSRGKVQLHAEPMPVHVLVKDIQESVAMSLEKAGVRFEVHQLYHGEVVVDAEHFRRALVNVITNAQEAMPHGGCVALSILRLNGRIEFRVSDTGVGIPPGLMHKMFDPFITHGKANGTGLGLAITKLIVEQHGGTIDVSSQVGVGTTFALMIPGATS
jgi:signal transduction histidine kinase